MNVRDILTAWLKEHGYDGLYCEVSPDEWCGCTLEDFAPCEGNDGDCLDCQPGYKQTRPDDWEGFGDCVGPDDEVREWLPANPMFTGNATCPLTWQQVWDSRHMCEDYAGFKIEAALRALAAARKELASLAEQAGVICDLCVRDDQKAWPRDPFLLVAEINEIAGDTMDKARAAIKEADDA